MNILYFSEIFIYHFFENLARYALGKALTERCTIVAALADHRVDRNLDKQLHTKLFCKPFASAFRKNIHRFAAIRTDKAAHIFHQSQHRKFHLLAEIQALCHIVCRNLLGSGNNDRFFIAIQQLTHRQRFVAGAGGESIIR